MQIFEKYAVVARTKSHHNWISLAERRTEYVPPVIEKRWWIFEKIVENGKRLPLPCTDWDYLKQVYKKACENEQYVATMLVGEYTLYSVDWDEVYAQKEYEVIQAYENLD